MAGFGFISRFAAKILAFDNTELPEQQFALIQDMLAGQSNEIRGKNAVELLSSLKKKHLVNSITIRRLNNGLVFSSSGNGFDEGEKASDVLNFANRIFDGTDFFSMRTKKEWIMLFPWENSLFIIKANSSVSPVELRAIAKEIEKTLKRKKIA